MTTSRHTPFDVTLYTGRAEPFEPLAHYWYQTVRAFDAQKPAPIALLGFACDQGVGRNLGRIGAKHAPDQIKAAFAKLPLPLTLLKYQQNIKAWVGDAGNIVCADEDQICANSLELAQQAYSEKVATLLAGAALVIGIGGGHEIAWGSFLGLYRGLMQKRAMRRVGMINLDAHFDLRKDRYATSGTSFYQIQEFLAQQQLLFDYLCIGISAFSNSAALFARAQTFGTMVISDDECWRLPWAEIAEKIWAFMQPLEVIYLTIDMDCLQGMPAVSAPAVKGLPLDFVERCIEVIFASKKVHVVDIAETNPSYDRDHLGVKTAARLLAKVISEQLSLYHDS